MTKTSKFKWIGGIILAGILLSLGLLGGDWWTSSTLSASAHPYPNINQIIPSSVPVGSIDKVIIISGTIVGNEDDTRIRFVSNGSNYLLKPIQVYAYGISVAVPNTLMTEATVYTVSVIVSDVGTIPTIPLWPGIDLPSNELKFTVFVPKEYFLPITLK